MKKELIILAFLVVGAIASDKYEDKDMTKEFVNKHYKELQVIDEFYTERNPKILRFWDLFIKPKNGSFAEFYTGDACHQYYISLEKSLFGNYSLEFKKQDIAENGKQKMFLYASECLEAIHYNFFRLQKINAKKAQEQNDRLNQKFTK